MLYYNFKSVFKARGVDNPYTFLVNAGLSPHTASSFLNNNLQSVKLKHIEIICRELHCTPNDLFIWRPDKNKIISETHPLNTLNRKNVSFDLKETMKTIPIDQLNQIVNILKQQNTQKSE